MCTLIPAGSCPGASGEDRSTLLPLLISTFVLFPLESRRSSLARTAALHNQRLERSVPVCSAAPHYPCFVRKTYPEVVVLLPPPRPLHRRLCSASSNPRTLMWEWMYVDPPLQGPALISVCCIHSPPTPTPLFDFHAAGSI